VEVSVESSWRARPEGRSRNSQFVDVGRVAVIRGSDGGRRMYGIGDKLPAVYAERFRSKIYNERVAHPGAWNRVLVVAREDDDHTMLNHALIQSRRRYRT
jgi:hypothetical protein